MTGTVTIPQHRVSQTKQHTHTHPEGNESGQQAPHPSASNFDSSAGTTCALRRLIELVLISALKDIDAQPDAQINQLHIVLSRM